MFCFGFLQCFSNFVLICFFDDVHVCVLYNVFVCSHFPYYFPSGWDLSSVGDIECIGVCGGIIGIISLPGVYDPHLIVIKESTAVGVLYPPNLVYKIKSICMLSDDEPDTLLAPCPRHNTAR